MDIYNSLPSVWIFTWVIAGRCDSTLMQEEDGQTVPQGVRAGGRRAYIGSFLWNRTTGDMAAERRMYPDTLIVLNSSICSWGSRILKSPDLKCSKMSYAFKKNSRGVIRKCTWLFTHVTQSVLQLYLSLLSLRLTPLVSQEEFPF